MGKPVRVSYKAFEAFDLYFDFYFERKPWARCPVIDGFYRPPAMRWEPAIYDDGGPMPHPRWAQAERKYQVDWIWKRDK